MVDRVETLAQPRVTDTIKWLRRGLTLVSGLIVLATVALIVGAFAYQRAYAGRIYEGVRVLSWDVSGMTPAEAYAFLSQRIRYYEDTQLLFRYGNQLWMATPRDLGARLDARAAVAEAYAVGRSGLLRDRFWQQFDIWRQGYTVVPRTVFDPAAARQYLESIAAQIERPARDADIVLAGMTAEVISSQEGYRLDVDAALAEVQNRLLTLSDAPIDLKVETIPPAIDDAPALEAKARIDRLLSAPVTVRYEDKTWTIERETLAHWLVFNKTRADGQLMVEAYIDPDAVRAWVEPLAPEVYQLPENARLDFDPETGQVTPIRMSREGRRLDVNATVERILAAVEKEGERRVELAVVPQKPAVDVRDIPKMGIVELISKATTYFKGSPPGRVKNIKISASKFHGVVIPPGEVFSFNEYLGEVSAEEGYEEAYIIQGNRTAVGIGGGICQVSTTAFRAAFWGGFPIVERWAHGYRVSWYEINSIPGFDATIYSPLVDFKFRNDTEQYILIETEVDEKAGTVTFFIYGTKPDREVELEGPIVTNETPPKEPVYEVDPSLPPGTIKQIDWANKGADVTIYRIIKQNGQVVKRERFDSHYQPWADVFLVGPGTKVEKKTR